MDYYDDEETLKIGGKTWNRVIEGAVKAGYREGVDVGSDHVLQADFDRGYQDGFGISFILGKLKALSKILEKNQKHPKEIEEILEATRRGECYICRLESAGDLESSEPSKVLEQQAEHISLILNKLNSYFLPLLLENNLKI